MPDAQTCLALPLGDFRGALHQPLMAFRLLYRHGPLHKTIPWIRVPHPEPFTHREAILWMAQRYKATCRKAWLDAWETAAMAWRRPDCPVAWPYMRVSHDESAASGLSFEMQLREILDYYRRKFDPAEVEIGPVFSDPSVSASKKRLRERRGGLDLMQHVQPGDHILFLQLDRGMRKVADAATLWEDVWKPQNITPHFVNQPFDLKTPIGKYMFDGAAAVAEYDSNEKSVRFRQVAAALKATGRPASGNAPNGWKIVRKKGRAYLEPDMEIRTKMARIEHLRDTEGLSWAEISRRVGGPNNDACKRQYVAWKKILADGVQQRPAEYERLRKSNGEA